MRTTERLLILTLLTCLTHHAAALPTKTVVDISPSALGWRPPSSPGSATNISSEKTPNTDRKSRKRPQKDPEFLLNLAIRNEHGIGFATNTVAAARLAREAAELGYAPAQNQLGLYLSGGIGLPSNPKKALQWWKKAAAQGYAPAELLIGYSYLHGQGVKKDLATAHRWFRQAAERNLPAAMHTMAVSYVRGRGVATNVDEAIRLFVRAAELGSYPSATAAGALLVSQSKPSSIAEGVRWARYAAEHGDTVGQRLLAEILIEGRGVPRDASEAMRWSRKAAYRGDDEADFALASYYCDGIAGPPNFPAALLLAEPLAKKGHAAAQNLLGLLYCEGRGVATNFAAANEWFRLSAQQGLSPAWMNLSRMHRKGWGVPQNLQEGFRCALHAAEMGLPGAQSAVAYFLLTGLGTALDDAAAVKWLTRAAAQGETNAVDLLGNRILSDTLNPSQKEGALQALQTASQQGSIPALLVSGQIHLNGILQPRDRQGAIDHSRGTTNGLTGDAIKAGLAYLPATLDALVTNGGWGWVESAAEKGDMIAEAIMAAQYLTPSNGSPDVVRGTNWLWRGIGNGHANCMYFAAELLFAGTVLARDPDAGLELMQRAANLGHAPAQSRLADYLLATPAPTAESVQKALRYYARAAEQDWPDAITSLGYIYCEGRHVPRNEDKGWEMIWRSAQKNEKRALYSWGRMLQSGERGTANAALAAQFLRRSAEQGFPDAQNFYGLLCAQGQIVARDLVEAWKWYELAAAGRDTHALLNMAALRAEITPEQMIEARRAAAAFKRTSYWPHGYMWVPNPSYGTVLDKDP